MSKLKLYQIEFKPMFPVPSGLIILAKSKKDALRIAGETIKHDDGELGITQIKMDKSKVVFYKSGDY